MSSSGITLHSAAPQQVNWRRWGVALLVVTILLVAGLGGWLAYSYWTTNQLQLQTSQQETSAALSRSQLSSLPAQDATMATSAQNTASATIPASGTVGAMAAAEVAAAASTSETAPAVSQSNRVLNAPMFSLPVITNVQGATLWDETGQRLTTYDSGVTLTATGRSADGAWLLVDTPTGAGWVETTQLIAYGVGRLSATTLTPPTTTIAADLTTAAQPATAETTTVAAAEQLSAATAPSTPASAWLIATIATANARLNVRSGPGVDYAVIGKAISGDSYIAWGRSEAGDWLLIRLSATGDLGWISSTYAQLSGDIMTLPVSTTIVAASSAASSSAAGQADTGQADAAVVSTATASPAAVSNTLETSSAAGLQGVLVFQTTHGGLFYAYHLATGQLQPLTTGFDPAVSPDGRAVAFVRDGGESGIYLIDIDGGNERLIFSERVQLSSPKWSPDGQWITFSRNDEYIECYNIGFNQCLLPDEFAKRFPFAQSGQFPLVKEYQHQLSVVDRDGRNFHDIAALNSAQAPDWSDSGIVYQSAAGLQRTADAAHVTTALVAFDALKPFYVDPDWQPGGDQIVFQVKGAAQWEIYVVNSDGSGMHALTRPVTALVDELPSNVAPAYSPDGKSIVFLSNRGANNSAGAWRVWVMDADGDNQRPLPIDIQIDYTFGLEQAVSWGG